MELQFNAFKEGDLKRVQQLFYNNAIDISANNEYTFRYTCYFEHLHIARWLLSVKPNINISADSEGAFCYACLNGYSQVAQWLLYIKPDINISANNILYQLP